MRKQQALYPVKNLLLLQIGIMLFTAAVGAVIFSAQVAYSLILGGLVYIIPQICFTVTMFRYSGAKAAKRIVNSFYKAEAFKLLLTILLFALVFRRYGNILAPLAFFLAYIIMQLSHWFAPLVVAKKHRP